MQTDVSIVILFTLFSVYLVQIIDDFSCNFNLINLNEQVHVIYNLSGKAVTFEMLFRFSGGMMVCILCAFVFNNIEHEMV